MKVKNIFMFAALASLGLASCDVTDVNPIDSFTDQSYWNTTNDLELYANGLYGLLPGPTPTGDNTSDNFVPRVYASLLFDETSIPASGGGWDFTNIRKVNFFLQRYQKVDNGSNTAEVNKYAGEVRFFRALIYFDKIKNFGDFPWYDKDLGTGDTDELFKARDSRDLVLGKIIEDLEFAIQWLPEKSASASGRLNKDAARTLLARVCLYYGTYNKYHKINGTPSADDLLKKAVAVTNDVINSGNYEIVKGSDAGAATKAYDGYPLEYANQFVQENLLNNAECILCRHYEYGVLTHETGRQVGENGTGLSKDFIESFLMKDGTPIYNEGSGYHGDECQEDEIADRDPRLYQLIDNKHKPYFYQNGEATQNLVANCTDAQSVTGYPCTKFRSANPVQREARSTFYDWYVYRYAEVLLINAEANAELGSCTQAVLDKTINQLRDRVGMAHLTVNPVADAKPIDYGYTVSNLIYEIRRERRIELVAEGQRLDDIMRWNATKLFANPKTMFGLKITDKVRNEYAQGDGTVFGGANGRPTVSYEGAEYLYQYGGAKAINDPKRVWGEKDRRWFLPIPTNELTMNSNLVQNPGW